MNLLPSQCQQPSHRTGKFMDLFRSSPNRDVADWWRHLRRFRSEFNVNSLDADHSFDELPDLKVVTRVPAEWDRRPSETWHGYDGRIRGTLTTCPREGVDQHPPGRQGCSRSSIDYNLDLALGCCQWKLMKWEVSASCWQPVALVHLSLTSTFHLPKTFRVEAPHLCNSGPGRYAWNYYNPCPVI